MSDQAEIAFLRGSQPVTFVDDDQQPPANSLRRIPVLQIPLLPPRPQRCVKKQRAHVPRRATRRHPRLLLKGKALADNRLVREYSVKDGDTVNLLVKPSTTTTTEMARSRVSRLTSQSEPQRGRACREGPPAHPQRGPQPVASLISKFYFADLPSSSSSSSPSTGLRQNITMHDISLTLDNATPARAEQELSAYHAGITTSPVLARFARDLPPPRRRAARVKEFLRTAKGTLTASKIARARDQPRPAQPALSTCALCPPNDAPNREPTRLAILLVFPCSYSHHPLDLPGPLASTDASKPSLKRKHPHKLARGHDIPPPCAHRLPVRRRYASSSTVAPALSTLHPRLEILQSARGPDAMRFTKLPESTASASSLPSTTTDTLHSQIPTLQISRPNSPAHRRRLRVFRAHRLHIRTPLNNGIRYPAVRLQLSLMVPMPLLISRTLRALETENELDAYKLDALGAPAAGRLLRRLSLRNKAPNTRLYRDCSAADLVFLTLLAVYITSSPITLPASLDALLALLPGPFVSASSSSSGSSASPSAYARRLDGTCAASTNHLRLAVSAGMVMRLHFLLAVLTHYAHKLRSAPSTPAPHYEGAEPLTTLPDPRAVDSHAHPHPLLPRAPLAQRRRVRPRARRRASCVGRRAAPRGREPHVARNGGVGFRYAAERGVCGSEATFGTDVTETRDSRHSRERRESAVRAKWEWS
ncbi:hypothetical protein C8J57DRAFT_1504899 [Mycena rebaudengoi]|nr:hypothetical protein C8J57DRAFT_1504899 [Mycena rebaudengoi]